MFFFFTSGLLLQVFARSAGERYARRARRFLRRSDPSRRTSSDRRRSSASTSSASPSPSPTTASRRARSTPRRPSLARRATSPRPRRAAWGRAPPPPPPPPRFSSPRRGARPPRGARRTPRPARRPGRAQSGDDGVRALALAQPAREVHSVRVPPVLRLDVHRHELERRRIPGSFHDLRRHHPARARAGDGKRDVRALVPPAPFLSKRVF